MTQLHVIPIDGFNLYAALTKKETELRRRDDQLIGAGDAVKEDRE